MENDIQINRSNILIVGDTIESLNVLGHDHLFNTYIAMNNVTALTMVTITRPDLIVIDITESPIDGFATCRRLKKYAQFNHIPVIFLSSLTGIEYKLRAFKSGAVDYIEKPFHEAELMARISTHLTLKKQQERLEAQARMLDELARTDPLTQLSNRRHFMETAEKEFSRFARFGNSFSIIMMDIDYFKQVNDTYGHSCGDVVLKKTAEIMKNHLRTTDELARWGGEEFIMLLPETPEKPACLVADHLRQKIADESFFAFGNNFTISVTMGVSSCDGGMTLVECINSADNALYFGKNSGRDRVASTSGLYLAA